MSKKLEPGMAFDMQKLNKVFAFLSILLLMTVFWVFLDDYIRPWKAVQIQAMKIKQQKIDEKISKFDKGFDKANFAKLEKDLVEAEALANSRKAEAKRIDKELLRLEALIKNERIVNGKLNSRVSAMAFKEGAAISHHAENAHELTKKLHQLKAEFAASNDRKKLYAAQSKKLKKDKLALEKEAVTIRKNIKKLTNTKDLLSKARAKTEMNGLFVIRNAPLGDFLDPTLKIKQIVAKKLVDDRYFKMTQKVDRCITCHTFIDQKGYEDQKNPFKTHPNLDLMVGMKSPHPMKEVGCTTCHGGEGHRVNDFTSVAHIPRNEKQKAEWVKKYNWKAPHHIPSEMFKVGQTEAGCVKCHQDVEFIPQATVLNEGRRNMEKFGCYGCHKIKGWENKRKPGPSLEKIAGKVSKEFFKNWVWDPKSFNKHANMPRFFEQSNNSDKTSVKRNITEVNAIAEFVFNKSKSYTPFANFRGGNKENGKNLIKTVGCMGCHGVEGFDEESKKINAYAGPYLTGTGSKIKSADWLVSWLKKPSHYQPDTIMPSFRLSDREANDIAAYLMSLRNKKFEALKFEGIDKEVRDDLLVTYLSAFDTIAGAKANLAKMSDHERTMELGNRSIGKYGCYSCHNIKGFEGRAPIGPELTKEGSKPLTQFFYGLQHDVEHSRGGWIKAHLLNPRRWDIGVDKAFKDKLRMPNFEMSERQAFTITTALLGQVSDYVPLAAVKRLNEKEMLYNEGMKVANKFNCVGCHKIDGERGDILAMFEDDLNEGPPFLVNEGHRVQADWLYNFLGNVTPIRPWIKVRMPTFNLTKEEKNKLVTGFQMGAGVHTFEENNVEVRWLPGEKRQAERLFKSLDCTSCHSIGFVPGAEATAPNLYQAKRRLRPSWIKKWISNPQNILEHTTMPNFWEDGQSTDEEIFGGDMKKQINALTKYLLDIGHTKLPQ